MTEESKTQTWDGSTPPPAWVEALGRDLASALDPILDRLPEGLGITILLTVPDGKGCSEQITLGNMSFESIVKVIEHMRDSEQHRQSMN
jgi:hypothetical protein